MEEIEILVVGHRGHKIAVPLSATSFRIAELCVGDLPWDAKLRALARMFGILLRRNVITIADYPGYFALIALAGSRATSSPFVLRLRGDIWKALPQWNRGGLLWLRLAVANHVIRGSDLIVPVSESLAGRVIEELDIPPEKIVIVPIAVTREAHQASLDGLPSAVRELLHRSTDYDLVVTVTNLNFKGKELGLRKFLPIFDEVSCRRQKRVLWLIAGDGRSLASVQQEIERVPSRAGRVHMLGYVAPIRPLIDRADLVVYFSYEDGFPNVPLEAQLAGKVVIVNNYPPLLEQVRHGLTGFVVDPTDVGASAELVCTLLDDHDLRIRIGEQARAAVSQLYSEDAIGSMFKDALCNVIAGG